MRRLVIQELEQHTGRKRDVRKVWEALKSKGQDIKRCAVSFLPLLTASLAYLSDFVEKFMKDIDHNGFKERRPRWKPETIAGLSNPAEQPLLPLKVPTCCFDIITTLFSCYGASDHSGTVHGSGHRDGDSPGAAVSELFEWTPRVERPASWV